MLQQRAPRPSRSVSLGGADGGHQIKGPCAPLGEQDTGLANGTRFDLKVVFLSAAGPAALFGSSLIWNKTDCSCRTSRKWSVSEEPPPEMSGI